MFEKRYEIETRSGKCDIFCVFPEDGPARPAVVLYMDSLGIREELRDMARRLASCGYFVLLPNLYYRSHRGDLTIDPNLIETAGPERDRLWGFIRGVYNAEIVEDTRYFLAFLDAHPNVLSGPRGLVGYCMSGRFIVAAAGTYGKQVAFAASYYGARIVDDHPCSAHTYLPGLTAHLYLGYAEHDPYVPETQQTQLRHYLQEAGTDFKEEIYPDSEHGFAFPERPTFNKRASERHWETLISLCNEYLYKPALKISK